LPLLSIFNCLNMTGAEPDLDYSKSHRMISLKYTSLSQPRSVQLPLSSTKLEILEVNLKNYHGPPIFTEGHDYPHLKTLLLHRSACPEYIDFSRFPKASGFSCFDHLGKVTLDLSEHQVPITVSLVGLSGEMKFPMRPLVSLIIAGAALKSSSLRAALPSIRRLSFVSDEPLPTCVLASSMSGSAGGALSSAHMEDFQYQSFDASFPLLWGAFPVLVKLSLSVGNHILSGDHFPHLWTFDAEGCTITLRSRFPSLEHFILRNVKLSEDILLDAPKLQVLDISTVEDAYKMTVEHSKCPKLNEITVLGLIASDPSDAKSHPNGMPTFDVDGVVPCDWGRIVMDPPFLQDWKVKLKRRCGRDDCKLHHPRISPVAVSLWKRIWK